MCTHRTPVAGKVRKLVHTKRTLVRFYVVAGKVCKNSAHYGTLITKAILSLLREHE